MRAQPTRAGRSTRLSLEALEDRTLPSATLPAPPPLTGTPAAQTATTQQTAGYSYGWAISPGAVLTGANSTGSVMAALSAAGSASAALGGPAGSIPLGQFSTSSSALSSRPDRYHTPLTISLKARDAASGATGTLTFKGAVTGTVGWSRSTLSWDSTLVVRFQAPTQKLTLAGRLYTVTLPGTVRLGTPDSAPLKVSASVSVSTTATATASAAARAGTAGYVTAAYEDILGRAPEAQALANWSAALASHVLSGEQFASALSHSAEHYRQLIRAAYRSYLGRKPDAGGLNGWLAAMQNGLSDEQLEAGFIGSREYIRKHGGPGAGWVRGLYHDLLGRTPSQAEVAGWLNALRHGVSPQQVAFGFAASAEREAIRVKDDYLSYLGRQASQAEVNGWVYAFEHGASNEDVVAGFIGSAEYHRRHPTG
jgi:hypothetical protein